MLTDSHCHLDMEDFAPDRDEVLARARAAGVTTLLAIGGGAAPGTLDAALRLAEGCDGVWASVGIHPHEAQAALAASPSAGSSLEELRRLAAHPKVVAIGEIGLDYHYLHSPRETQLELFRGQLALAAELDLPVSIHSREAWDDCFSCLRALSGRVRGVLHCFSGGPAEMEKALELGFYLSFSGMLTFARAQSLREVARLVPAGRLLVETDSPYLAPVPYRGRRNEPAYVAETARALAAARGAGFEEIAALTSANFLALCPRARPTGA